MNCTEKCNRPNIQFYINILAFVHEVLCDFNSVTIILCVCVCVCLKIVYMNALRNFVVRDAPNLVGDPLLGNGFGSPNHN